MTEKERFEAWFMGRNGYIYFHGEKPESEGWYYFNDEVNEAWIVWQAACDRPSNPTSANFAPVQESAGLKVFTEYFVCNYPGPDTIIHNPYWHAPKIYRAALAAATLDRSSDPDIKPCWNCDGLGMDGDDGLTIVPCGICKGTGRAPTCDHPSNAKDEK